MTTSTDGGVALIGSSVAAGRGMTEVSVRATRV